MTASHTSDRQDTRPGLAFVFPAVTVIVVIVIVGLLAIPYGSLQLGTNTGFLPAFGSMTFMGDALTALLLLLQARVLRDKSLACLGGAYLFSASIIIPHLLAFPGVFGPAPLIGTSASAVWLWVFWHGGFALGVINFALRRPGNAEHPIDVFPFTLGAVGLAGCATLLSTIGEPFLPTILVDGSYARLVPTGISPSVLLCSVLGVVLVFRRLRHPSILTVWLAVAVTASMVDVALTMLGAGRFTLGWYLARCLSLVGGLSVLCALLADFIRLFTNVAEANRQLEELSLTDPLTNISNRRSFERRLNEEWRRAAREQMPVSLVMIDIDHFKLYNDKLGHPAGDECLRTVAAAMTHTARRPWDMPARLGGEEFAVLLPNTEAEGAATVAEMFRSAIERLRLPHPGSPLTVVTVSVGVATAYPHHVGSTPNALIDASDAALYMAKQAGRNRVHQNGGFEAPRALGGVLRQVSELA